MGFDRENREKISAMQKAHQTVCIEGWTRQLKQQEQPCQRYMIRQCKIQPKRKFNYRKVTTAESGAIIPTHAPPSSI